MLAYSQARRERAIQAPSAAKASAEAARTAMRIPSPTLQISNQVMQRRVLQPKLTISQPGDVFEQEADRIADRVMRMPESSVPLPMVARASPSAGVQRACACGGTCEHCKDLEVQRSAAAGDAAVSSPSLVQDVIRSTGRSLDDGPRQSMERRFGRDFGAVRIHTDARAAESARSVNALAYTTSNHIVFGAGQYAPASRVGQKLIAHELTHVLQQQHTGGVLQRTPTSSSGVGGSGGTTCTADISKVPAPPFCIPVAGPGHVTGKLDFEFPQSGVALSARQVADIAAYAAAWKRAGSVQDVQVNGWASCEGDQRLNWRLSCERAEAVKRKLIDNGVTPSKVTTFAHGASSEFSTSDLKPNRRAILTESALPPPPPAVPKCGPDVTDWFVDEVNHALADPAVLAVKRDLSAASFLAARLGTTAALFADAGAVTAVEAQERALSVMGITPPARTGAIVGQLAAGTAAQKSAAAAVASAIAHDPIHANAILAEFAALTTLLAAAALKWKTLVNHKARFDFKAHILNHISLGSHCPDPACPPGEVGNLTLCPGSSLPQNCYEADLPGNLFYALVGRFVGLTELTLQLGSQLAELTDLPRPGRPVVTWDSPQDTAAIHLGFGLGATLPLSRASLCGAVPPAHGSLDALGCDDCLTPFPLKFV
jgi:outer membrane protein OmpA-like peptidoglycan-associated protein